VTADGQLMVGFRVPLGSEGPDSFATDAHFDRSASYTQAPDRDPRTRRVLIPPG